MKKVLIAVLTLTMLLTAAVGAMAETFTLSVPCQAIADSQLYNHHATAFAYKRNSINTIYVSHHVTQTSAVETNRIAAYRKYTAKTMGANWHRADSGLYQCMSNAIVQYKYYTVAGRGNTNYASKYGLNNITLTGYFLTDND